MTGITPPRPVQEIERVRSLARLLDTAIRIPGTNLRFGLDAILGLVPGIGDVSATALSGYIVIAAARLGVPRAVLGRMLLNLGVDTVIGTIPLLGDIFDVRFKSNVRNAALLERYIGEPVAARGSSRWVMIAAVAGIILLALGGIALAVVAVRGLNWLATG